MAASLSEVLSFGRYEPLFRVAAGGMAEVYAARIRGEAGFEKLVAIKRMLPHLAADPSFVTMFLDEARLAAHIDSPFVVSTLDLGRSEDGTLYMVMDFVLGLPLLELARAAREAGRPVPIPVAVEVLAQVARGLDDAHEATTPAGDPLGLIHRDVSPHNILLGIDGRARISDFGVARALRRSQERTRAGHIKGKVGYMSPEQSRQELIDRRSDIFSLGIVAWELVTGRRLFDGVDLFEVLRSIRAAKVPPPEAHNPELPAALAEVIKKSLSKHREARYESAGEMARALRRVGRELGEPPDPKEIGRFVVEAGGEPLAKLRELIRLSNEGADAARLEKAAPAGTVVIRAPEARQGGSGKRPIARRGGTAKMKLPPSRPPGSTRPLKTPPPAPGSALRETTRPIKNPTPAAGSGSADRRTETTRPIKNPTPATGSAQGAARPSSPRQSSPPPGSSDRRTETTRPIKNPTPATGSSEGRRDPTRPIKRKARGSVEETRVVGRKGRPSAASQAEAAPPNAPPRPAARPAASGATNAAAEDPEESAPTEVFSRSEEIDKGLLLPPRDLKKALDRSGLTPLESPAAATPSPAPPRPSAPPQVQARKKTSASRRAPRPTLAWAFAAVALLALLFAGYALYRSRTRPPEPPQQTLPE